MPGAVTGVVAAATEVAALAEAVCDADANPETAPPVTVVVIRASVPAARQPLRIDPTSAPLARGPAYVAEQ